MKQEEAIERIKARFDKWALDNEDIKAIQALIPELREIEDEKIRKELIEFIQWSVDRRFMREDFHQAKRPSEWIAWLEKQEIFSKNGEGCYYYHADGSYTFIGSMGFGPIEDIKFNGERPKTENKSVDLPDSVKINGIGVMTESEEEDERIRKALIDGVSQIRCKGEITREQMIAYLEKQKETKHATDSKSERVIKAARSVLNNWLDGTDCPDVSGAFAELEYAIREYDGEEKQKDNPKSADSIPSDCTSDAKCEDRWHKVADSFPDSTREVICKDAIGNFFIGRYYKGTNSWKVSMYDDVDKSNEDNPPVVMWCDIPSKKQKERKPIKIEVYEAGKGTTICGQDYKCKKDYKVGNCWYIKDVIYHCGRDGYLTDQNGVSWSCTPKWFNEYIQSNTEWAEEEKTRFVSGRFLQCKLSFDSFKEGEHYWLEYVGDDMYVGRSDNILNQKFHITPRQLFTLFSQELEEVQGPSQEEKQVSLNYEPLFNENPSDREIVEALIYCLVEQEGFLTAINCVSTKAILSWLEKHLNNNSLT